MNYSNSSDRNATPREYLRRSRSPPKPRGLSLAPLSSGGWQLVLLVGEPPQRRASAIHPATTTAAATGVTACTTKVHASGRIMVAGQNIKLGPRHRAKIVTVVNERHPSGRHARRRRDRRTPVARR